VTDPNGGVALQQARKVNGTLVNDLAKPAVERYYEAWYDGDSGAFVKGFSYPPYLGVCGK
jgi:hypothetical protein